MFGRGACDNKGQHLASLKAAEYSLAAGGPPLNLRFLIEGEEEGGGDVLPHLLKNHADELRADYVFIHDGTLLQLLTGLRGNLYVEVEVTGAAIDLHSGAFGGLAPNPFNTLAHVLAGLKDRDGHILVVMTHNSDYGDAFEREGESREYFEAFAGAGYAFGVDTLLYSLTH